MGELPRNSQASFSGASSPTLPLPLPTTGAFRHSRGRKSGLHLRTRTDEEETDREEGYDHNTTRRGETRRRQEGGRKHTGNGLTFLALELAFALLVDEAGGECAEEDGSSQEADGGNDASQHRAG